MGLLFNFEILLNSSFITFSPSLLTDKNCFLKSACKLLANFKNGKNVEQK